MGSVDEGLNALELLRTVSSELSLSEICKMTPEQTLKFRMLLEELLRVNASNATNKEKGDALENLSRYLLDVSGRVFNVCKNLLTSTNEIDLLIELNTTGMILSNLDIIDKRFSCFISECKNHGTKIDVTYIGKFCSLLLSNQVKTGILFSYHGITGSGWTNAAGLIKKFYLSRENLEDRFCIIDFNINDFMRIKVGENFFQIVNEKLKSLRFDTDYSKHLSKHPAEV